MSSYAALHGASSQHGKREVSVGPRSRPPRVASHVEPASSRPPAPAPSITSTAAAACDDDRDRAIRLEAEARRRHAAARRAASEAGEAARVRAALEEHATRKRAYVDYLRSALRLKLKSGGVESNQGGREGREPPGSGASARTQQRSHVAAWHGRVTPLTPLEREGTAVQVQGSRIPRLAAAGVQPQQQQVPRMDITHMLSMVEAPVSPPRVASGSAVERPVSPAVLARFRSYGDSVPPPAAARVPDARDDPRFEVEPDPFAAADALWACTTSHQPTHAFDALDLSLSHTQVQSLKKSTLKLPVAVAPPVEPPRPAEPESLPSLETGRDTIDDTASERPAADRVRTRAVSVKRVVHGADWGRGEGESSVRETARARAARMKEYERALRAKSGPRGVQTAAARTRPARPAQLDAMNPGAVPLPAVASVRVAHAPAAPASIEVVRASSQSVHAQNLDLTMAEAALVLELEGLNVHVRPPRAVLPLPPLPTAPSPMTVRPELTMAVNRVQVPVGDRVLVRPSAAALWDSPARNEGGAEAQPLARAIAHTKALAAARAQRLAALAAMDDDVHMDDDDDDY